MIRARLEAVVVDGVMLVFYEVGAGGVWFAKECRTSYVDEWAERHETGNSLVASVIFSILFGVAMSIHN